MQSFRFWIVLALFSVLIFSGAIGCRALGDKKSESSSRSHVIKRSPGDESTVSGWVGGERPSY